MPLPKTSLIDPVSISSSSSSLTSHPFASPCITLHLTIFLFPHLISPRITLHLTIFIFTFTLRMHLSPSSTTNQRHGSCQRVSSWSSLLAEDWTCTARNDKVTVLHIAGARFDAEVYPGRSSPSYGLRSGRWKGTCS